MIESMEKTILAWDTEAFKFINIKLHNEFAAGLMKICANDVFLCVLVLGGLFFVLKRNGLKGRINAAFTLWVIIISNILSSFVLKRIFKRERPYLVIRDAYLLVNKTRGYGYSFPSTHTFMATVMAVILWEDYKKARPLLVLFVLFVGFFCIYTGGHYPSDVAAGFILGIIFGKIANWLKKIYLKSRDKALSPSLTTRQAQGPVSTKNDKEY